MISIKEKIISDLRALGIEPSDTILVHSSLKSLGWVEGGAVTVIEALSESVSNGTLLMPSLSYQSVNKENPIFSVRNSPCCVGTIPETFRTYSGIGKKSGADGVFRSVHPTHSVCARGVNAEKLTNRHYLDRTPVGENSPFRLMLEYGAKILMLGCGLKPNTFMHGVEEAAGTPYVLKNDPEEISIEYENGSIEKNFYTGHNFDGVSQRYDRVSRVLDVTKSKILKADVYVIDAGKLWDAAAKKIKEEPWFFVDKK